MLQEQYGKNEMYSQPPYTNRGVERTEEKLDNKIEIHWISATIRGGDDYLRYWKEIFISMGGGSLKVYPSQGYKECVLTQKKIRVLSDGCNKDMGLHVVFPGDYLEKSSVYEVLGLLKNAGARFSRVDIAVQTEISQETVMGYVFRDSFTSRFKNVRINYSLRGQGGSTVYFGSRQSDLMLRVYDKGREEGSEKKSRWEFEIKGVQAEKIGEKIFDGYDYRYIFCGLLKNNLMIRDRIGNDDNKRRWPVVDWYNNLIKGYGKMSFAEPDEVKEINEVKKWLEDRISKSVFKVARFYGKEWLDDFYEVGKKKFEDYERRVEDYVYDGI